MADYVTTALVMLWMTNAPAWRGAVGAGGSPVSDPAPQFAVGSVSVTDPVEAEYQRLLELDDAAQEDIDRWIREADALGPGSDNAVLQAKIDERIEAVTRRYRAFIENAPDHSRARVAFGSFLHDTGDESGAKLQWEKALELDPKNPAIYNNLAGIYGHRGPITNAFTFFEKAIELDSKEAVYFQNLATTVFLFRKDVMEHYGIADEQRVFDKALGLYRKAMELDPGNFVLATDTAQTYYGIRPPRHVEALAAWNIAFDLASDELERQGVRVHLARILVQAGRYDEARTHLERITDPRFGVVKERIEKTLDRRRKGDSSAEEDEPKRGPLVEERKNGTTQE